MAGDDYKVELEVFEGPLDLLLYLIRRDEVDIYNIPIEQITSQYMEYLDVMRMLDLNIAGEFIVMAATLMMIKSRMLLPVDERPEIEEEEEDPRWDLVRQLVEYKKFKDAAIHLQDMEFHQEHVFDQGGHSLSLPEDSTDVSLQDVSLFDLIAAFSTVLKQARAEDIGEIAGDRFTVRDKIDAILLAVRGGEKVAFSALFTAEASRSEILCTFLALLELIRLCQIKAVQKRRFGEIMIRASDGLPQGEDDSELDAVAVSEEGLYDG